MPEAIHYLSPDGYRWRLLSCNGAVLAVSAKPYKDERTSRRAFTNLLRAIRPMVAALGDS